MSFSVDTLESSHQLVLGNGYSLIHMGLGDSSVRGSGYLEGPIVVGNSNKYLSPSPTDSATLMIGESTNNDSIIRPFYSLMVQTFARIKSYLKIDFLLSVRFIKAKVIYTEKLFAKVKNFRIDHPLDPKNKYLVYSSLEGPEVGVYFLGRLRNSDEILIPKYWKALVDSSSITVQLQPIGSHQEIAIKGIEDDRIIVQSRGGLPIDCYYHIFAERKDVPKLKVEVSK